MSLMPLLPALVCPACRCTHSPLEPCVVLKTPLTLVRVHTAEIAPVEPSPPTADEPKTDGDASTAAPEAFRAHNADRKAEGDRLREAIRGVLAAHPDQVLSARQVLHHLDVASIGRNALPDVRTVQRHLRVLYET